MIITLGAGGRAFLPQGETTKRAFDTSKDTPQVLVVTTFTNNDIE